MNQGDDHIEFVAFGVEVDIVINHHCNAGECGFPSVGEAIGAMLPPGAEPRRSTGSAAAEIAITCSGDTLAVTSTEGAIRSFTDLAPAVHAVDQATRSVIAVHAPGLIFIHAGVVAVDGRALVLPGKSMAGKTTLVAELVRAGAQYYSDEYAVFDEEGLVHPFARRLSVREPSGRREVSVDELGGTAGTGPLPVAVVASVAFCNDASWDVSAHDQGACARALIANAVAAQIRPAEVLAVTALVARSTSFIEGTRGEAPAAVPELLALARS